MNQHTKLDEAATIPAAMARAAEYVRMSTDHQRYSTENQADAIREYAARRGLTIVKTYADHGKSGLSIAGRDALQTLLDDVRAGRADFQTILVYDVSRWGRFQDADESAYYEYVCKRTPPGTPEVLLTHHLKVMKLPTFLREHDKLAR